MSVVATAAVFALVRFGGGDPDWHPITALVDPSPAPAATAVRVLLLAASALTAGAGLVRALLGDGTLLRGGALPADGGVPGDGGAPGNGVPGDGTLPAGVRRSAWAGGLVVAGACVVAVFTGQAAAYVAAVQLALALAVPLLLASARQVVAPSVLLAGLLAAEQGSAREGLPLVLDVVYAPAGAALLGAALFSITLPPSARLGRVALGAGLVASVTGTAQLLITGPRTDYDALHTAYGLAALAQAAAPVLATLMWAYPLASRHRAGELSRMAAGGLLVAFAAAAALATLPRPAAAPEPGQALLRPVDLPLRHLAVQVLPMRPGPNLVHIGATDPSGAPIRQHHGAPLPSGSPGGLLVSVGEDAPQVTVAERPGAPGGWAVVDIPVGANRLTITGDGVSADVPVDVGTEPGDPAVQRALTGPDGPECASAALGALVAGHPSDDPRGATEPTLPDSAASAAPGDLAPGDLAPGGSTPGEPAPSASGSAASAAPDRVALRAFDTAEAGEGCPSAALSAADTVALRDTVNFLAQRGITGVHLVADDSPRAVAAQALVRAEAAARRLPVTAMPQTGDTLLVVSGWARAAGAVAEATERAAGAPSGGVVLAPWLLASHVLNKAPSEVLPLSFNPQETEPRQYATTVAAVFPGETPSAGGYLAWAWRSGNPVPPGRPAFYGAAPVDVPMGIPMAHGVNPAGWYPSGTVVAINPPLGDR
ncbi:hypothetical protein GCM10023321_68060 [Pseudonocardia eucalypti]|uniref:Uncharacterized protein n=1 Tax=Pseudonocardia eucalypti TaxID=648755 RepID=A0ABP9R3B2_9PSEU|nr:hypothetical protein [Pseudonocardia eucalypti]